MNALRPNDLSHLISTNGRLKKMYFKMSISRDYFTIVVCDADSKPTSRIGDTFYLVSGMRYSVRLFNHHLRCRADVEVYVDDCLVETLVILPDRSISLGGTFNANCKLLFLFQLDQTDRFNQKVPDTQQQQPSSSWWPLWKKPAVEPVVNGTVPVMVTLTVVGSEFKKK